MRLLALIFSLFISQYIFGQELITDIIDHLNRDKVSFKTLNDNHYVSVRDHCGHFNLYQLSENAEADLIYSEPLFLEPYTHFLENDKYLLYIRGNKAFIFDIFEQEERFILASPGSRPVWVQIGNDLAIMYTIKGFLKEHYLVNLSTAEIVSKADNEQLYVDIYNETLYSCQHLSSGFSCTLNNLNSDSVTIAHTPSSNFGNFYDGYFTHKDNGKVTIVNPSSFEKIVIEPDLGLLSINTVYKNRVLYTVVADPSDKIYEANITTQEVKELQTLPGEFDRQIINDSLYLIVSQEEFILLNRFNENSTSYSSTSYRDLIINDKYIVLNDNPPLLIDVTNKNQNTIINNISYIKTLDYSTDGAIMLIQHGLTSSIWNMNKNNLDISEYKNVPINKLGLKQDILHPFGENLLVLDNDILSLNNDTYTQLNNSAMVKSELRTRKDYESGPVYWLEKSIDNNTEIYKVDETGKQLLTVVIDSTTSLNNPINYASILEHEDKLFAAMYDGEESFLYDLSNNQITELTRASSNPAQLIGYHQGNLFYGYKNLHQLTQDGSTHKLNHIKASLLYFDTRLLDISGERLIVTKNGLFKLEENELVRVMALNNPLSWYVYGTDFIITQHEDQYYRYDVGLSSLYQVWQGFEATKINNREVLLRRNGTINKPQIFNTEQDVHYPLPAILPIKEITSWHFDGEELLLSGFNSQNDPNEFLIVRINNSLTEMSTVANISVDYKKNSSFIWNEDEGLLVLGNKAYVCDSNFNLREISDFKASSGNIQRLNDDYYLFGLHPSLGKQVYIITDLSNVMVGVEDYDLKSNSLVVYPNPAQEYIQLDGINEHASYSIYDINGKRIADSDMKRSQISVSQLSAGTYFIHVMAGETISVGKVVVVR